jgi:hypothetical protein
VTGLQLQLLTVLTPALLGGVLGWRVAARRRSRSFFEQPVGMSDRRFAFIKWRRRLLRRLAFAVPSALTGALVGWIIVVALRLR